MIKIDCSDKNCGEVMFKGSPNLVLNEIRYVIEYSIKAFGAPALEAIYDGVEAGTDELIKNNKEGS